jgi:PQQ-dependent catabolism-associated beta-propeller protein
VGIEPEGLAVSRDGKMVVVVSESTSMAHFIDVPSRSVVANVLVDTRPRIAEFRPGDRQVWVSSEVGGTVSIIDSKTREITGKISFTVPLVRPELVSPVGIRFTPDGKTAFVALGRANRVAVVNAETLVVEKYLLVGDRVWQLVLSSDAKTLYAANGLTNDVSVIDLPSLEVIRSVPVGRLPWGLAITP